jgi:hypothetical protein
MRNPGAVTDGIHDSASGVRIKSIFVGFLTIKMNP